MTGIQENFEETVRRKLADVSPDIGVRAVEDLVIEALRETGVEQALGFAEAPWVVIKMAGDHVEAHIRVVGSDLHIRLAENL